MANNDEPVIVHSDDDGHQPPLAMQDIIPIGPPSKHEPGPDDEEEQSREAIQARGKQVL